MLIAKEKRKTNIAEYILYLWQIEDLLRAQDFDLDKIGKNIVSRFDTDDETRLEIYQWYKNLVIMMQKEQVTSNGHVQFLTNMVDELNRFHIRLLQASNDSRYVQLFQIAKPLINEFRGKSLTTEAHDIQVGLQLLYSILLMKLKGGELLPSTLQASSVIGQFIGHLAARYRQYEEGEFEI